MKGNKIMTLKKDMGFLFFFIRSAMGKVSDGQIMAKLASRSCSHKLDYKKNRTIMEDGCPTFYLQIISNL